MSQKQYDVAVFIGRMQPLHNAHVRLIDKALSLADKVVIVLGSGFRPRDSKNPFTQADRSGMIYNCYPSESLSKQLVVKATYDTIYDDEAWAVRVQKLVAEELCSKSPQKIALVGCRKAGDNSTFYLDMFPQWEFVDVPETVEQLNATQIREIYFNKTMGLSYLKSVVPEPVYDWLKAFKNTAEYQDILDDVEFIKAYKKQFAGLPYSPTFNTIDAVVVQSGHVLLVRRGARPGKGQWALVGGFLDAEKDSSLQSAMIRELREETKIKVPDKVLIGNIKEVKTFDAKGRSTRGRTITQAFYITLPAGTLPKVKGSDDADKARWVPLSEIKSEEMFEDHFEIIQYFTGGI